MKWIIFFQTPYDRVRFTTDEIYPESDSLVYKKFTQFIFKYPMIDPGGFQLALDTFQTVRFNAETQIWEKLLPTKENPDFETLLKFNPSKEEQEKKDKDAKERPILKTKEALFNVWMKKNKQPHKK